MTWVAVIAAMAVIAVAGVAVSAALHSRARPPRAGPAADSVVAVLPFAVASSQPVLRDLRDALHDLVAARLTGGDGTPRALATQAVLESLRRANPAPQDSIPLGVSLRVGEQLRAGHVLRGEVSGTAESLSVAAELLTVSGGVVQARARVEGGADDLPYLADRLVARLLAVQAARDSEELAALTATSLSALRSYLAGWHAYRRGRGGTPSEATEHYERALSLDSTFALAALRLAETAAWGMRELDERWKLDALWQRREQLGRADGALLEAYLGARYPHVGTLAERILAGNRATRTAPHRVEAWRIAGRSLFLLGPTIGYPDWEAQAGAALRRALALDSTDAFTLQFLLRLAAGAGDSDAVRHYTALYLAHNAVAYNNDAIRWLSAVVLRDNAGLTSARRRLPQMHAFNLRALVEWSPTIGLGLEDADRAARLYEEGARSVDERRAVIVGIVPFLLNRGRPSAASRLLAMAERGFGQRADVGVLEFRIYAALHWDGDSAEAAAAARSLEAYVDGASMRMGHVRSRETARCALAHWRLAAGDFTSAEAALKSMRQGLATTHSDVIESSLVCAAAATAHLAAARGRANAGAALARLEALLAEGSDARHLLPAVANLIAAHLHETRGDLHQALALARRRTIWGNQLLSSQLRQEGRLAALVGDTAGAVRAYRHYLALRSDPEPALRSQVERVRAELTRIKGGSDQN